MNAPAYTPMLDTMKAEREAHEAKCRAGTLYPDRELAERAVRYAVGLARRRKQAPWVVVTEHFVCGSTVAAGLCRRFGFDPDTGETLPIRAPR